MEIKTEKMCTNEIRKAGLLLVRASELGMDLSGYGELSVNYNSGNVYLWLEDYNFTLYIDLNSDDIKAMWSSSEDGREESITLEPCTQIDTITGWADYCQREDDRKFYHEEA